MHKQFKYALLPGLIASALALTGCGSSSGDSSTDPVNTTSSRGIITGFGSVYVNGVKYETDTAEIEFDDNANGTEDNLRVGQLVTVTGSVDASGTTGTASRIAYENELQGPISSITPDPADPTGETGTLDVLGIQITVDANTNLDGIAFSALTDGSFVEVSGFTTESGITATYIEPQNDSEIEIVGSIEMLDVVPGTFEIRGFTVAYDSTDPDDGLVLADGLYVEVEGALDPLDDSILVATEIEAEDEGKGDDDHEAEVQGIVSNYDSDTKTFNLGTIQVDASTAILNPASLNLGGDPAPEVEAEGHWLNGVLIADEIKQKGQKIKINGVLTDVESGIDPTAGTITFNFKGTDIVVRVNQQTEMEDDINEAALTFPNLSAGNYVEIEAFNDGSGDINAVELELKDINDGETRIVAPVDSFSFDLTTPTQTVTLLGATFDLLADGTSYENELDIAIDASTFFDALDIGVFIKLKDDDSNGTFEKAELED